MAIYHLSIKIFSRGKGASSVAKAAYRAAECITSEYDGKTSDYTRKRGVIHKEIILPENAPSEYKNRSVLWNAVEKSERYKTAQLAREIEVALPRKLTNGQNLFLVREYIKKQFVNKGMCADFYIHDKGDGNPHCHIMLTMRSIDKNGEWEQKSKSMNGRKIPTVDWNDKSKSEEWRSEWSVAVNAMLEHNNHVDRVDHRSFVRQGKDELPTVHLGVAASQMEQKGIRTERGNTNREIMVTNNQLRQLKARINKLSNWLAEESKNPEPPTLAEVFANIIDRKSKSEKQEFNTLKSSAKTFMFLQDNNIRDFVDLETKVKSMKKNQSDLLDKLKPVERRLKTLTEHIKEAEVYKEHRDIAKHYNELCAEYSSALKATGFGAKRKVKNALSRMNNYYRSNETEMILYEASERYIKDVMQERYNPKKLPPITKWKQEFETLTAERKTIYRDYNALKYEVKEVEKIKRSVEEVLREDRQREKPSKNWEAEL